MKLIGELDLVVVLQGGIWNNNNGNIDHHGIQDSAGAYSSLARERRVAS